MPGLDRTARAISPDPATGPHRVPPSISSASSASQPRSWASASSSTVNLHARLSPTLCCNASKARAHEDDDIETMDDLAFRYAETMDALGLDKVAVAGACVGGWIAAELAMRHPERVTHLVLIGASGLEIPDQPIGDLFWEAQPRNGTDYSGMRRLLFGRDDAAEAVRLFPDSRGELVASTRATRRCGSPRASASIRPISTTAICAAACTAMAARAWCCGASTIGWCRAPTARHTPRVSLRHVPRHRRCGAQPAGRAARGNGGLGPRLSQARFSCPQGSGQDDAGQGKAQSEGALANESANVVGARDRADPFQGESQGQPEKAGTALAA